ncbi:MAG: DUF4349 domain-containing protein [Coriobacteriia bacterium]|nr:DUF4349 domain-containing protein [Coriobacteriia bacterium]
MRTRLSLLSVCALLALALLTSTGCSGGTSSSSEQTSSSGAALSAVAPSGQPAADTAGPTGGANAGKGTSASPDRLVITTAAMNVGVDDLSAAVASIRALTQQAGGSISQLTISDNSESPAPEASAANSSGTRLTGPANASLTLRIPAASLPAVETKVAALGKLVSQTSSESDVTQQHIDMTARLANLRAEETRLRALLTRAGTVSDLLSVERELSRVRGDIESMQAQLAYLEGQAAMATLTVTLDQPGPVVRPSAGGWGLVDAVTTGVQGAAVLVREIITAIIALSPLIVIGAIVWWLLARRARKHRTQREALAQPAAAAGTPLATDVPPRNLESPDVRSADNAPPT